MEMFGDSLPTQTSNPDVFALSCHLHLFQQLAHPMPWGWDDTLPWKKLAHVGWKNRFIFGPLFLTGANYILVSGSGSWSYKVGPKKQL